MSANALPAVSSSRPASGNENRTGLGAVAPSSSETGLPNKGIFTKKESPESKLLSLATSRKQNYGESRSYLYLDCLSSAIHTPKSALTTGTRVDIIPKIRSEIKTQFDEPETKLMHVDGTLTDEYKLESRNTAAVFARHILSLDAKQNHRPDRLQATAFNDKIAKKLHARSHINRDDSVANLRDELADLQRDFGSPHTSSTSCPEGPEGGLSAFGTESKVRITPLVTTSSLSTSTTPASAGATSSRLKKYRKYGGLKERPKKIFSRDSLIQCIMDTTEFYVEARNPENDSLGAGSLPERAGSTISAATLSKPGKWSQDSIDFAYQHIKH